LNYQEIGIGYGQNFIFNRKHYGFLKAFIDGMPSFLSAATEIIILFFNKSQKKKEFIYIES
jgi:hypothetical protein